MAKNRKLRRAEAEAGTGPAVLTKAEKAAAAKAASEKAAADKAAREAAAAEAARLAAEQRAAELAARQQAEREAAEARRRRPRYVRPQKEAAPEPPKAAPLARSNNFFSKLMTKNIALPPKDDEPVLPRR